MGLSEVANPNPVPSNPAGQRGPVDHERRHQIMAVARDHFRLYGYHKTTIADLAREIGVSSGYIYIFFESKQAVGDAICDRCLGKILTELQAISQEKRPAADRLRDIYEGLVQQSKELFFSERKLHDIVLVSFTEGWASSSGFQAKIEAVVRQVIIEGRTFGEFERKTPLDETCRAIMQTLLPFSHPLIFEKNLPEIEDKVRAVAALVLRSLAA